MTAPSPQSAIILGPTLSGLALAHDLATRGYRVTVMESPAWSADHSFHAAGAPAMILGCHRETQRWLRRLAPPATAVDPVPIEFTGARERRAIYRPTPLPRPFHWIASLFRFRGLTVKERWAIFAHLEQMWEQAETIPAEVDGRTAADWLASLGQSEAARRLVWDPVARWLTGNPLPELSAALLSTVLRTTFLGRSSDARLAHWGGTFSDRLFTPLRRRIAELGVEICTPAASPLLRLHGDTIADVMAGDTARQAAWYISALHPTDLLRLLPERLLSRFAYFARMAELRSLPAVTVQSRSPVGSPSRPRLLLSPPPFECIGVYPWQGSGISYRLRAMGHAIYDDTDDHIAEAARSAVCGLGREVGDDMPASLEVHRHRHAALALPPGSAMLRPIQTTPLRNFFVVGDWTDTGWPADVESALVSVARGVEAITLAAV